MTDKKNLLAYNTLWGESSYLVEQIRFNLPVTESIKLKFVGQVAAHDIRSIKKGAEHG